MLTTIVPSQDKMKNPFTVVFSVCIIYNLFFFNSAEQSVSLFQTLEVLMLDDNKLSSPGVFMSLANLKR